MNLALWKERRVVALGLEVDSPQARDAVVRFLEKKQQKAPEGLTMSPVLDLLRKDGSDLLVDVLLPDSASIERVEEVLMRTSKILAETTGEEGVLALCEEPPTGRLFIHVKDGNSVRRTIRERLTGEIHEAACRVLDAHTLPLPPDRRTAVSLIVQDEGNLGRAELTAWTYRLRDQLVKSDRLADVWTDDRHSPPVLTFDVDGPKIAALGLTADRVRRVLNCAMAGETVIPRPSVVLVPSGNRGLLDFDKFKGLKVRTPVGKLVPLGDVASNKLRDLARINWIDAPARINHVNGRAAAIVERRRGPRRNCQGGPGSVPRRRPQCSGAEGYPRAAVGYGDGEAGRPGTREVSAAMIQKHPSAAQASARR